MSDLVPRLWKNNWLNFRKATESVLLRDPNKLYIAFEVAETIVDANGVVYKDAINVLNYIYSSPVSHTIVLTFLDKGFIEDLVKITGLKYDWMNNNIHFNGVKPYYDILIDSRAGFQPTEWNYVFEIYKFAEKILQPTKTHQSVFHKEL